MKESLSVFRPCLKNVTRSYCKKLSKNSLSAKISIFVVVRKQKVIFFQKNLSYLITWSKNAIFNFNFLFAHFWRCDPVHVPSHIFQILSEDKSDFLHKILNSYFLSDQFQWAEKRCCSVNTKRFWYILLLPPRTEHIMVPCSCGKSHFIRF